MMNFFEDTKKKYKNLLACCIRFIVRDLHINLYDDDDDDTTNATTTTTTKTDNTNKHDEKR